MKISYVLAVLMACITLVVHLTRHEVPSYLQETILSVPIKASSLEKKLYYDWPSLYQKIDALTDRYGANIWEHPDDISPAYWNEITKTPIWLGFFPQWLGANLPPAPWFEKISQGEVWRTFTPALLHVDLFHLVFNLFWLIALGRIVEERVGIFKYLLLSLVIGIVSNTAQYLMTGLHFYGYSGVISGLFGYTYVDKKKGTPYPFPDSLFPLTFVFIFGMAAIDTLLALSPVKTSFGIANTAHITGLLTGIVLGYLQPKK